MKGLLIGAGFGLGLALLVLQLLILRQMDLNAGTENLRWEALSEKLN